MFLSFDNVRCFEYGLESFLKIFKVIGIFFKEIFVLVGFDFL